MPQLQATSGKIFYTMKILFLHGFFASGQCEPAMALKEAFEDKARVIVTTLPGTEVLKMTRMTKRIMTGKDESCAIQT